MIVVAKAIVMVMIMVMNVIVMAENFLVLLSVISF